MPISPLTVSGEDFLDASGKKVRLWGVNVVALYPPTSLAEKFADNLVNRGVNLVRWHHMMRPSNDWVWNPAFSPSPVSLVDYSAGDSRGIDATAWERFNAVNKALADRGVYIMLANQWTRSYLPNDVAIDQPTSADGVSWRNAMQGMANIGAAGGWAWNADKWKMLTAFDSRAQLLEREFLNELLTRPNAAAGMAYKDNPQVLAIELVNEHSMLYAVANGNRFDNWPGPDSAAVAYFQNKLVTQWNAYCAANGATPFDLYNNAASATDDALRAAFLNGLDKTYFDQTKAFVNGLNPKIRLIHSSLWRGERNTRVVQTLGSQLEDHRYSNPNLFAQRSASDLSTSLHAPADPKADFVYDLSIQQAVAGKPFVLGEFNLPDGGSANLPIDEAIHRPMQLLAAAAYGALHNWAGVCWFAWCHGDVVMGTDGWAKPLEAYYQGRERRQPDAQGLPLDRASYVGSLYEDGVRLDHMRTAGALFKNGLLSTSTTPLTIYSDNPLYPSGSSHSGSAASWPPVVKNKPLPGWQSINKIRKAYGAEPGTQPARLALAPPTGALISDTNEIRKDIARKQLTVAASKAEAFSGVLDASAPAGLQVLRIAETSNVATVILVSEDDAALTASRKLRLSRSYFANNLVAPGPTISLRGLRPTVSGAQWRYALVRPRENYQTPVTGSLTTNASGDFVLPGGAWTEIELTFQEGTLQMGYYVKTLDNETVLTTSATSPGPDWTAVTTVQAAFDKARTDGRPLFIQPGVYTTGAISVLTTNGSGRPLTVRAVPGTVTLRFTGGDYLVKVQGVNDCTFEGLTFDGASVAFTNMQSSSALLRIEACIRTLATNCTFANSLRTGVYVTGGAGPKISDCRVYNCSYGIFSLDSTTVVSGSTIESCSNNGVMIWRSTVTGDSSYVVNCLINNINNVAGGTGQYGNGVNIFRAVGVVVNGNRIFNCQYSFIRCNGGGNATITNNNCYFARETGFFLEAPQAGINFNGGTVVGNSLDNVGCGINVVNSGFGGQGVARRVTVCGNHVTNVVKRTINDAGYVPTVGIGAAIVVEGACVVSGNIIDGAQGFGVIAGTNSATQDLNVNGNLILSPAIGIGWGRDPANGQVLITSNQIRGATGGSIVPVGLDATSHYVRIAGSADYGNQASAQIVNAFIGNNRAY